MRRVFLISLAALLVGFALVPIAILFLASGLPDFTVRPTGISLEAASHWRGPRLSLLLERENAPLWRSLLRTGFVAFTASLVASTLAVISAYAMTRRRSWATRHGVQFLSLAAYGLPSVFLMLAIHPLLVRLSLGPDVRVWLLHLLYILPMSSILAMGYAASHPMLLDRSAAIDGAGWSGRLIFAYRANLWRGHLAVMSIGCLVSWGDLVFSQQILSVKHKLLADLYDLRYFDNDSTTPDYASAAIFSLVLTAMAVVLAWIIAATNRRGV